ncbi:MAG: hypothetical protein UFJ02_09515 [Prevotella sp.]|nr:hypothetical protein [Prevotella sp.]
MEEVRRCGAHEIVVEDKMTLVRAVVEIFADKVVNCYEFRDELPMTEWLGGRIDIKRDEEGILRAYHLGRRLSSTR